MGAIVFSRAVCPMTTQPLLLKLAKQGDAIAIATLMNAVLKYQHIRVSAQLEDGCLRVMLKSAQPIHQHAAIAFIRRGLWQLQAESIDSVRAYAWYRGQDFPAWVTEFAIDPEVPKPEITQPETAKSLSSSGSPDAKDPTLLADKSQEGQSTPPTPPHLPADPPASTELTVPAHPTIVPATLPAAPPALAPQRRLKFPRLGFVGVFAIVVYVVVMNV